jgi:hypothetical protein
VHAWPPPWSTWRSRPPLPWPQWTPVPSSTSCFAGRKQQPLLDVAVHRRTCLPHPILGGTTSSDADTSRGATSTPPRRPHTPPCNTSRRCWGLPRLKHTCTCDGDGDRQRRIWPSGRTGGHLLLHGRHFISRPRRTYDGGTPTTETMAARRGAPPFFSDDDGPPSASSTPATQEAAAAAPSPFGRVGACDNPPRKIPYYRLNQSTLVIKR